MRDIPSAVIAVVVGLMYGIIVWIVVKFLDDDE